MSDVHNLTVKPLADKMKKAKLSAKTMKECVKYTKQIVASLRDGRTGEPVHHRKWASAVMDLPVVNVKAQRRPTLRADAVKKLVSETEGEEQALYVLLAATGLRISEALALETRAFINGGHTIEICQQQLDRDIPRIEYLKTDAACREVDLSAEVAEFLRQFIDGKDGLLFQTRNRAPYFAPQSGRRLADASLASNEH